MESMLAALTVHRRWPARRGDGRRGKIASQDHSLVWKFPPKTSTNEQSSYKRGIFVCLGPVKEEPWCSQVVMEVLPLSQQVSCLSAQIPENALQWIFFWQLGEKSEGLSSEFAS